MFFNGAGRGTSSRLFTKYNTMLNACKKTMEPLWLNLRQLTMSKSREIGKRIEIVFFSGIFFDASSD
jgi:hypothetical protein